MTAGRGAPTRRGRRGRSAGRRIAALRSGLLAAVVGVAILAVIGPVAAQGSARLAVGLRSTDGTPVAGARLELRRPGADEVVVLFTDAAGEAERGDLEPGAWRLRCLAAGFAPAELDLELRAGVNAIDLELPPADGATATAAAAVAAYRRGVEALEGGRHDDAVAAMRQALETLGDPPADPVVAASAWKAMARAHVESARIGEAIEAYERALEVTPDDAYARLDLANLYHRDGRLDDADVAFAEAVRRAPSDPQVLYNAGAFLMEIERLQEATAVLERSIELRPRFAPAYRMAGHALAQLGELDRAVARLRTYLELAPDADDADEVREFIRQIGGGPGG